MHFNHSLLYFFFCFSKRIFTLFLAHYKHIVYVWMCMLSLFVYEYTVYMCICMCLVALHPSQLKTALLPSLSFSSPINPLYPIRFVLFTHVYSLCLFLFYFSYCYCSCYALHMPFFFSLVHVPLFINSVLMLLFHCCQRNLERTFNTNDLSSIELQFCI